MKKKLQAPDLIVFTFIMMAIAMVLTWVVPAGSYTRYFNEELNRTLVDPNTFQLIEQTPVGIMDMLAAIPGGFEKNISVIAYVMGWGGAFGILIHTNLIEDGIKNALCGKKKASFFLIVLVSLLFSAGGAFVGIQQSFWSFTPVVALMTTAMGYDIVVAFVAVAVANNIGYMCGPLNMWNTGVAQQISELPLFSGLGLRLFIWVLCMALLLGYTYIYARKVAKDPSKSIVYDLCDTSENLAAEVAPAVELTPRRKVALGCLVAEFVGLVIMIAFFDMTSSGQIAAWLTACGIIVAVVNGNNYNEISQGFVEGVKTVLVPCIVVGMAGGILSILEQGNTLDTILHAAVELLSGTSSIFGLLMIYLFQFFFNFLVPSGTAQAATTMPIIAPLSDLIGVSRQCAVLAFQFGDGFSNMIWPTACLAPLAFTNIPFKRWLKWFMPFTAIIIVVSCLILVFASIAGV